MKDLFNLAGKSAIHHLDRTLTAHLADRHITANAVAPGLFPSKMKAGIVGAKSTLWQASKGRRL